MQGPVLSWHKSRGLGFTCVSSPEKKGRVIIKFKLRGRN